ncbi:MAG: DUF998 domain-containing protein [Chitinophagaceae bacterium]|nr:DUF998 domain-containing protein [Chitinophagaceae bacterium]
MTKSTVSNIGIAGVVLFVAAAISGALLIPGYSQVSNFLSESYAIDTTYGIYLRLMGYIPSGLLILFFCFSAVKYLSQTKATTIALRGIGLFYGGGTILTGIFPCDAGCNKEMINPSVAQFIHSISGLFSYVTVPFFVIMLGFAALKWKDAVYTGKVILLCGFVSLVFAVLFFSQLNSPYGGLIQRILEGSILLSITFTAFYLKK